MTNRIRQLMLACAFALLAQAWPGAGDALAELAATQRLRPLDTARHTLPDDQPRVYIVRLAEPAAVSAPALRAARAGEATAGGTLHDTARGSRAGKAARKAKAGRFDSRSPGVREYAERLTDSHDKLLAGIGAGDAKLYSYRYTFNGFAARLTPAQARALRSRKDVLGVWENKLKQVETNASPSFLGLRQSADGLWTGRGLSGEGIVIGIIDSGITPGHASFGDRQAAKRPRLCRSAWADSTLLGLWLCKRFKNKDDRLVYTTPADWQGVCQAGDNFRVTDCNNKLIGARYYIDGFLDEYDLDENEFISPRDADGHGTHLASVAAGNRVRASLGGTEVADVSGIAHRARIAVYKACWLTPGAARGSCSIADLTRAIEDAVADGVDIINYSVGSFDDIDNPDDLALLAASDAGVLTVAAAGNDGPTPGTMLSPAAAPWVVAVGASSRTGDRFQEAIRVDAPEELTGGIGAVEAAFTPSLRTVGAKSGELVLVNDGTMAIFSNPVSVGTVWDACEAIRNFDEVDGNIALVQRGGCDFEVKVRNAQNAGAIAVVVVSHLGDPVIMTGRRDSVSIPAVMIGRDDGELLRQELLANGTVEVTLDKRLVLAVRDPGNVMEGFSSRGPSLWTPDIVKPDVTAPGVEILGAQTPDVANGVRGERFQYLSGTSMAVPHVAGIAALLKEAHPDWSPAALKSALVTTARQDVLREDGESLADPLDFGGGHVVPNRAVDPGLVYDAGPEDFDAFLCGRGLARLNVDCDALEAAGYATAAIDLNLPSIGISSFVHEQVIRRRVTNVGEAGQYSATVDGPSTIGIEVVPAVLSLGAGESADFEVRFSTTGTTLDAWQFGSLTWSDGTRTVRSPLAIQAAALGVPAQVNGSGTEGSLSFTVRAGYSGAYSRTIAGMDVSGEGQPDEYRQALTGATVADDPDNRYVFVDGGGTVPANVRRFRIVVPEDTLVLRVALFNEDTAGEDDLDLYLYECPSFGTCISEVTPSGRTDSNETITLVEPPAGEYFVDVHGFETEGASTTFDLSVWTLGPDRGNATASGPASVSPGATATVELGWQDLAAGRNLGLILHGDGNDTVALTIVDIDSRGSPATP